jgi:hypothetical protein
MFKKSLLALAAIAFAGCSTTTPSSTAEYAPTTQQVEILSEPAGARIEINDNYVGDAPITVNLNTSFATFGTVIRAIPIYPGQWVQTKIVGTLYSPGIPSRVFFDMNLVPAGSQ